MRIAPLKGYAVAEILKTETLSNRRGTALGPCWCVSARTCPDHSPLHVGQN
jgi:hypothetical protein